MVVEKDDSFLVNLLWIEGNSEFDLYLDPDNLALVKHFCLL